MKAFSQATSKGKHECIHLGAVFRYLQQNVSLFQTLSPLVYGVRNSKLPLIYTAFGSLGNVFCHLFAVLRRAGKFMKK